MIGACDEMLPVALLVSCGYIGACGLLGPTFSPKCSEIKRNALYILRNVLSGLKSAAGKITKS